MKSLDFSRYTLSSCIAMAMLAGCGGSQLPIGAPGGISAPNKAHGKKHSQTFSYTGAEQNFMVPKRITNVTVTASGASGGLEGFTSKYQNSGSGGLGGRITATIPVTPGETLDIFVGGAGDYGGLYAGYNGGGEGGSAYSCSGICGWGGGGASDVRQGGDSLADRVVVAGGGAGAGTDYRTGGYLTGGYGGGKVGSAGEGSGGSGGGGAGTQSSGGSGGHGGKKGCCRGGGGASGALGQGGSGGEDAFEYLESGGGGGGGGYYGGGGGGGGGGIAYSSGPFYGGAGGGGGSSYVEPQATHVKDEKGGATAGNGVIVISWLP
jgi:hypothetical protein